MYSERRRENWTQKIRKENLLYTAESIKNEGGYSKVLINMHDFERHLAFELGCSIKTAKEYIETVRGAMLFRGKNLPSEGEKALQNKDQEVLK